MGPGREREQDELGRGAALTLFATSLTLLGVILSIAVTVGFGIRGPWWLRLGLGAFVGVALVAAVKVLSRSRRGPLTRFASWIIGAPEP